jgi:hypothetical protein
MHTIFSDGDVWPDTRVEEAWADGLDVIAITDHDRYHPHKSFLTAGNTAAYTIAAEVAAAKNILLLKAVEVTRKMPPGHFNALFVTDGDLPELQDTSRAAFLTAMEKLHSQGAVIFWNHPGWAAQQKDTVKWFDIHTQLLEKDWLHGIEVFNFNEWYPVALGWSIKHDLAPFANSDVHGPMRLTYDYSDGFIRPMTLVFAQERTPESIREAILASRTVAWFNGQLAGSEALLGKIFDQSQTVTRMSSVKGKTTWLVTNRTDFTIECRGVSPEWTGTLSLPARSASTITVPEQVKTVNLEITNWHTGMKENLRKSLSLQP